MLSNKTIPFSDNTTPYINRKQRRITKSTAKKEPKITFRGMAYTIEQAHALAVQHQEALNNQDAEDIYRSILAKVPSHVSSLNNLGLLLSQFGDVDEAITLLRRAIHYQPNYSSAYHNLGNALTCKGVMQEAEKMQCKALSLKPDFPRVLYSLTHMRKYQSPDHADAVQIKNLLSKSERNQPDQEHLYFALGKIYDDCSLYDEAFTCYHQANQIINATVSYNPALVMQEASNIIDTFSKDFLAQPFSFASDNSSPVFIVGMPRSGTTLLANILSNHSAVAAAGELPTMIDSTVRLPELLGNGIPYPRAARHITHDAASTLIKYYESCKRRGIRSNIPYIIDKHPINFRHLGFISMLFPKAHIIHCTRNPLDICLSNYFQYFDCQYNYSFDLQNTGHFYSEYARLMEHWRESLPTKMLEISYEDMVMNIEQVARQALKLLGLEWDERCLSPHTNPRIVKTASVWQVRQPVYRQSLERWRHYEKYLEPLKGMLS